MNIKFVTTIRSTFTGSSDDETRLDVFPSKIRTKVDPVPPPRLIPPLSAPHAPNPVDPPEAMPAVAAPPPGALPEEYAPVRWRGGKNAGG